MSGELTGCGRFAASCVDPFGIWTWLAQLLVIVVLIAAPPLAAISAAGTIAALAAAVPAAVMLSAAGGSNQPETSSVALAVVVAVAYVAGVAFAVGPEARLAPRTMTAMSRRHDTHDLSAAAQEYLLALRVMAGRRLPRQGGPGRPPAGRLDPGRERDVPAARSPTASSARPTAASSC